MIALGADEGDEFFVEGDRGLGAGGVQKLGAAALAAVAVERELRNDHDLAADLVEREVDLAVSVFKKTERAELVGKLDGLGLGIVVCDGEEDEKAPADGARFPLVNGDAGALNAHEDCFHGGSPYRLFAELGAQSLAGLLVAGLAEQREHILLVGLDTGLIEGIDAEQIAGQTAGELKEVNELAEGAGIALAGGDDEVGDAALDVGEERAVHRLTVDEVHGFALKEVQAVAVDVVVRDGELVGIGGEADDRFQQRALALLDILTHGVQVGGEIDAGGEEALALLALAFAVELLPPLRHEAERRLEAGEQLDLFTGAVELVAHGSVLPRGVGVVCDLTERLHLPRAGEQGVGVHARDGDGEQADRGEDAVASADVVGYDELLVALGVREGLESALVRVGGGVNALRRARLAVLLLKPFAEEAEGDGGLGGRAGLGNDVDGEVIVADELHHLAQRGGGQTVADEVDVGGVLFLQVVVGRAQTLDHAARAEVAAADADDDKGLGVALDLFRGGENARIFRAVVLRGQADPADEIVALAAAVEELALRALETGAEDFFIGIGKEGLCVGNVDGKHDRIPPYKIQSVSRRGGRPSSRR